MAYGEYENLQFRMKRTSEEPIRWELGQRALTEGTQEKLVLDWRKRQQSRAQVRVTIEEVLDKGLPEKFPPDLYRQKCDVSYQHFYDS